MKPCSAAFPNADNQVLRALAGPLINNHAASAPLSARPAAVNMTARKPAT
jgi:hypothetical protein